MSIIHDALKKTQNKMAPRPPKDTGASPAEGLTAEAKSSEVRQSPPGGKNTPPALLLVLVLIVCGMIAFFLIPQERVPTEPADTAPSGEKPIASPADKQPASLPKRASTGTASGTASLTLSGIIMDDAEPLALINERVLKVGDVIEGMTVTGIYEDKVEIRDAGGETVTLQIGP